MADPQSKETMWTWTETPQQYLNQLLWCITPYKPDQLSNLATTIYEKNKLQSVVNIIIDQSNKISNQEQKRQYLILKEYLTDYYNYKNNFAQEYSDLHTDITSTAPNNETQTFTEDYITFPIWWLDRTKVKNTILQAIEKRQDSFFTNLCKDFKTFKDKQNDPRLTDQVRQLQEYLNTSIDPSPNLVVDGKFGQKTYDALQKLKANHIAATKENPWNENIDFDQLNFDNIQFFGWWNWTKITKDDVIKACKDIPNETAKREVFNFLKNQDIKWLQRYLNDLLNSHRSITSWAIIHEHTFSLKLAWSNIKKTTTYDWWNNIKRDGKFWPQTLLAIQSIEDIPPIDPLETNEWQKNAIKEQIKQALAGDYKEGNVTIDLSNKSVSIKFETTENWTSTANTLVYNYENWEIAFKNSNNTTSEILKLDQLAITWDLKEILKISTNKQFQLFAELGQLFATARATKCKDTFYCKYDITSKEIKVCTLEEDTTNNTFTERNDTADLFDNENTKDPLITLDETYFNTTSTLAEENIQKSIARFMTVSQLSTITDETQKSKLKTFLHTQDGALYSDYAPTA